MKYSFVLLMVLFAISLAACGGGGGYYYQPSDTQTPPETPQPPLPLPPNAPYNLSAIAMSQSVVTVQWTDNSDNEEGFLIYRDNSLIGTTGANANIYQDTGLEPATIYQYMVTSYNEAGESGIVSCTVRTPNPPITVTLEKIGVYDNREPWTRGVGDVYVGIIVTDGITTVEKRFPPVEGQCYSLDKNEMVDIEDIIFSTNEVGDYIRIAAIGYEDDGGLGETLLYQALGIAAEAYISGGTATLLEMADINLGNLLAKFFGAEDDWLGSYENSWGSNSNWGIGSYTDIVCEDERGILCLRLWFTIESQ
jgi:predicted small lipoprotein YifL